MVFPNNKFSLFELFIPNYSGFYNWINDDQIARDCWHCQFTSLEIEQFGCTIVPLHTVRALHEPRASRTFQSVHESPLALPWRCLFHHPPTNLGDDTQEAPPWYPDERLPRSFSNLPSFLDRISDKTIELELPDDLYEKKEGIMPRWIVVISDKR